MSEPSKLTNIHQAPHDSKSYMGPTKKWSMPATSGAKKGLNGSVGKGVPSGNR